MTEQEDIYLKEIEELKRLLKTGQPIMPFPEVKKAIMISQEM